MSETRRLVRQHAYELLAGFISLAEFYRWFAPFASRAEGCMVRRVELRLAEYRRGDWTKDELLRRLMWAAHLDGTFSVGALYARVEIGGGR
jgi:hypothetical protein